MVGVDFPWFYSIFFMLIVFIVSVECSENENQQIVYITEEQELELNLRNKPLGILKCKETVNRK